MIQLLEAGMAYNTDAVNRLAQRSQVRSEVSPGQDVAAENAEISACRAHGEVKL